MRSVVICGSRRFVDGIRRLEQELKSLGVVVYPPHLHEGDEEWDSLSDTRKDLILLGLTWDHFQKIRQADVVFVYNKDGYIGINTTLEIGAAAMIGKTIYALAKDTVERGRNVLIREYVETAEDLLTKL